MLFVEPILNVDVISTLGAVCPPELSTAITLIKYVPAVNVAFNPTLLVVCDIPETTN